MIDIYDIQGTVLRSVAENADTVHEQELMVNDLVRLSWNDVERVDLPVGTYIIPFDDGIRYMLFEEYSPSQKSESEWEYKPEFQHPVMWLSYVPFFHLQGDTTSWATADKKSDWSFSGYASELAARIADYINEWGAHEDAAFGRVFGSEWVAVVSDDVAGKVINIPFSSNDVMSAAAAVASQLECEYHFDFDRKEFRIGTIMYDTPERTAAGDAPVVLKVGDNIGVPSISASKDTYYNRYLVKGNNTNISQEDSAGNNVQVTNMLTLDESVYPDSIIDLRSDDGSVPQDIRVGSDEPALTGEMSFEDVYPKIRLYIYGLQERVRRRKIDDDTYSDTDLYSTWYCRLAQQVDGVWQDYVIKDYVKTKVVEKSMWGMYGHVEVDLPFYRSYFKEWVEDTSYPDNGYFKVTLRYGDLSTDAAVYHYVSTEGMAGKTQIAFLGTGWRAFYDAIAEDDIIYITSGVNTDKIANTYLYTDRILDQDLQINFLPNYEEGALPSPLTGRTFTLVNFNDSDEGNIEWNEDEDIRPKSDAIVKHVGLYRIDFVEEGALIIPTSSSAVLYPRGGSAPSTANNIVSVLGVKVPDVAVAAARVELRDSAFNAIRKKLLDNATYTFSSNPVAFNDDDPELFIGKIVTFSDGQDLNNGGEPYTLTTKVRKLVTRLDFPEIQTITIGNEKKKGAITTLKEKVDTLIMGGGSSGGGGITETQFLNMLKNYGRGLFLSKQTQDTAAGRITFQDGLTVGTMHGIDANGDATLGDVTAGDVLVDSVQSKNYVSGSRGFDIDEYGNAEFESIRSRSYIMTEEMLINRLQAQEGDTVYTDNDQIEAVRSFVDTDGVTHYVLTLKEKWDGYFTSQQYGNIVKGIVNTFAAYNAGVSDHTSASDLVYQSKDNGGNYFYTSWMQVVATHNTDEQRLGINEIEVVLYGDSDVPAQKNFEPCELMTIARRGCFLNPNDTTPSGDPLYTPAEQEGIRRRQRLFEVSVTDGRIQKLTAVNSPILADGNYGVTIGTLPEFVRRYVSVRDIFGDANGDYLYANGAVIGAIAHVNITGEPVAVHRFVGDWVDGKALIDAGETPTVGHGIYYLNKWNEETQQFETHQVRHNNGTWECTQSQPYNGVYYEPKWNSASWRLIDGDGRLSIEFVSSNGYSFRRGYVDTTVEPMLFFGAVEITEDIAEEYWSWTRTEEHPTAEDEVRDATWNAQHEKMKTLVLTNRDMPPTWSSANKAIFTCSVSVNDGQTKLTVSNILAVR